MTLPAMKLLAFETATEACSVALFEDGVEIALVPFTLRETTLSRLSPADEVNVEVDVLAKYAERLADT